MNEPRTRRYPEIIGAALATVLSVAIWFVSEGVAATLRVKRLFITSAGTALAAFAVSITLVGVVLVAHARASTSVTNFIMEGVAKKQSPWRRGMIYFLAYEWPIALASLVFGILVR